VEVYVFTVECSGVLRFSQPTRNNLWEDSLSEIALVLRVDVRNILEEAVEEALRLFLDVAIIEEVGLAFLLVLL